MKRIAHLITGLETGGAQVSLLRLVEVMDRERYRTAVISLKSRDSLSAAFETTGIATYHLGMGTGPASAARGLLRLNRVMRSFGPDVVHGWMYHANLAALVAARFVSPRPPVVWSVRHSLDYMEHEKRSTALVIHLGAKLSRECASIVYNSRKAASQHRARGYDGIRGMVIPNGFDCDLFRPAAQARSWLRGEVLNIPEQTLLIGMVARYHPIKDHETFLGAAGSLSRTTPGVDFLLVGQGVDPSNRRLMSAIARNGLQGRVHLLGGRSDVPRLMAGLDIVTSCSQGEAFPNVIGEAMACGVPCVASDVGDSARLVGDAGIVIPPRDPEALHQAWKQLIESGQECRAHLGAGGRERVLAFFSLRSTANEYQSLYDSLARHNLS